MLTSANPVGAAVAHLESADFLPWFRGRGEVKWAGIQLTREGMFHGLVTKDLYIRHGTVVGIVLGIEQSLLHQGCVGR